MIAASGEKKTRLLEMYHTSLERQIQRGNWSPVCRDEELYKETEGLLSKGSCHDNHSAVGFDPLSVMEASLQAQLVTSGQTGLGRLAKAFEVLELAALNLYLCPWRKEYRVVKMFSGMFTHYVKPALTPLQVEELFGLLGYVPGGAGDEEQLRLRSRPVPADALLTLAHAFFTARVECSLQLCALAPVSHGVQQELQLVQERLQGHSLKVALERMRRMVESTPQNSNRDLSELDMYTDQSPASGWQTESDHMAAPPNYAYIPPEETLPPRASHGSSSQSERVSEENAGKAQTVCVSTATYQMSPKTRLSPTQRTVSSQKPTTTSENKNQVVAVGSQINESRVGQRACSCFKPADMYAHQCIQCREVHSVDCSRFTICKEQGHDLQRVQPHGAERLTSDSSQSWESPQKDVLKTHSCMNDSQADFFVVCHNCHDIHDFKCEDFKRCQGLSHYVQVTGKLRTPQGERRMTTSPERHSCLSTESPDFVVCHTCNKSHDYLCGDTLVCLKSNHAVKYQVEVTQGEPYTPPVPMALHECCVSTKPDFACLTCKAFHAPPCDEQCLKKKHKIQKLLHVCITCTDADPYTLCRYCCGQYCKPCWFKSPVTCKCGMLFESSSV
ncbi:hypothetical protein P4O66_018196 [Electrophorus voltai]|uniref:Spermatogenesis-associated protein 2 PUB-like domain-containing protein n=1 Tax=Electrophorus voltai TaxID=2609070 RepID=A0AAD8YRL5_9TELE|nr:hypothetical protein P4O66_018196 [Electrophorus voltai]